MNVWYGMQVVSIGTFLTTQLDYLAPSRISCQGTGRPLSMAAELLVFIGLGKFPQADETRWQATDASGRMRNGLSLWQN